MNRLLFSVLSLFVFTLIFGNARPTHAQELVCSTVAPSSAALLSDGTLGVGFGYRADGTPRVEFSNIRSVTEYQGCYQREARLLMEQMCKAFVTTVGVVVDPPPSSCVTERRALEISSDENLRLRRTIKRLKARLARQ